ncbi:MAG: hypothetical protein CMF31_09890 [Kordiimonas sp.]|nr:hypothetical protein [Kordiimonas sp.]|tara:strand:+ start:1696 stop:2493 length:798 start_codon:yes stop_codon:yes gene_type:complete
MAEQSFYENYQEYKYRISSCVDAETALGYLQDFIKGMGFEDIYYTYMIQPYDEQGRLRLPFTMATNAGWYNQWFRSYQERQYFRFDPFYKLTMTCHLPVAWELTSKGLFCNREKLKLTANQHQYVSGVFHHGVSQGVLIPLPLPDEGRAALACFYKGEMSGDEYWHYCDEVSDILLMAGHHFHAKVLAATPLPDRAVFEYKLTARQRDCLHLSALGKSYMEIAEVLGVSERTVRYHCQNAQEKLGASNRMHAVALAIYHNIITSI